MKGRISPQFIFKACIYTYHSPQLLKASHLMFAVAISLSSLMGIPHVQESVAGIGRGGIQTLRACKQGKQIFIQISPVGQFIFSEKRHREALIGPKVKSNKIILKHPVSFLEFMSLPFSRFCPGIGLHQDPDKKHHLGQEIGRACQEI